MAQIPFGQASNSRSRGITPPTRLINWFVEADPSGSAPESAMLLQRPGLERWVTLSGTVKALVAVDGSAKGTYAVAGNTLYSLANGAGTALGMVAGNAATVKILANFDRILIISDGHIYIYGASIGSTDNSFREIVLPDDFTTPAVPIDVCMMNDYFFISDADGTVFWLAPGDDDWSGNSGQNALNFFTAQSDPDGNVACASLNGYVYFFGTKTMESWQSQASADSPLARLTGSDFARGCLSRDTLVYLDNTIFWAGDDGLVYRATGGQPTRISSFAIEEMISNRRANLVAWTYEWEGHKFYVLRIPGEGTYAYDVATKQWAECRSEGAAYWRPFVGGKTPFGVLVGDSDSGAIWKLGNISTDDGGILRRTVSATVAIGGKPVAVNNVVLDVGSSAACTWYLRWADADEDLDSQAWIALPAVAGADQLLLVGCGAARAPYRTIAVEITDPVTARLSGGRVNEGWQ